MAAVVITDINYINAHPGEKEASADSGAAQAPLATSLVLSSSEQSSNALLLMLAADNVSAVNRRK